MCAGMANVRSILENHEAEIVARIASIRAELVPLERELMEVRLAKAVLKRGGSVNEQPRLFLPPRESEASNQPRTNIVYVDTSRPNSPYARLTIKELVRKALSEQFPSGATANQLLELFSSAWGRSDIVRTSLSPQLSRLGAEGLLFRKGQVWHLSSKGTVSFSEKTAADS